MVVVASRRFVSKPEVGWFIPAHPENFISIKKEDKT